MEQKIALILYDWMACDGIERPEAVKQAAAELAALFEREMAEMRKPLEWLDLYMDSYLQDSGLDIGRVKMATIVKEKVQQALAKKSENWENSPEIAKTQESAE